MLVPSSYVIIERFDFNVQGYFSSQSWWEPLDVSRKLEFSVSNGSSGIDSSFCNLDADSSRSIYTGFKVWGKGKFTAVGLVHGSSVEVDSIQNGEICLDWDCDNSVNWVFSFENL